MMYLLQILILFLTLSNGFSLPQNISDAKTSEPNGDSNLKKHKREANSPPETEVLSNHVGDQDQEYDKPEDEYKDVDAVNSTARGADIPIPINSTPIQNPTVIPMPSSAPNSISPDKNSPESTSDTTLYSTFPKSTTPYFILRETSPENDPSSSITTFETTPDTASLENSSSPQSTLHTTPENSPSISGTFTETALTSRKNTPPILNPEKVQKGKEDTTKLNTPARTKSEKSPSMWTILSCMLAVGLFIFLILEVFVCIRRGVFVNFFTRDVNVTWFRSAPSQPEAVAANQIHLSNV